MRADVSGRRAAAFVKRLMQVAATAPANFAAGAVFLISEFLKVSVRAPSIAATHAWSCTLVKSEPMLTPARTHL